MTDNDLDQVGAMLEDLAEYGRYFRLAYEPGTRMPWQVLATEPTMGLTMGRYAGKTAAIALERALAAAITDLKKSDKRTKS